MKRTRAQGLALVNWKGVFYQRYELNPHVTALEGANAAGKTTVMIAAYVVLLPDMSRLRFANIGETGASGGDKGIWGRLGEQGRPSYAALDFLLPGSGRLIAGVHLERKGEPSVEPTPFIVSGLAAEVPLEELLLLGQGEVQGVPELPELQENAARLGVRLQRFASAREYFAALFDEGVTPLRMGTDEERNKLNEMLRTSMTGGISRGLTSELRSFLLKEETGLSDTLSRMRANLEACRRTRGEVKEARQQEQEIGSVFAAGQLMFAAAFQASRERAEELSGLLSKAQEAHDQALESERAAREELAGTAQALEELERRRATRAEQLLSARAWETQLREALAAARELSGCQQALEQTRAGVAQAQEARALAAQQRDRARKHYEVAKQSYLRQSEDLADFQKGLDEVHRQAAAFHRVTRQLQAAGQHLGIAAFDPGALEAPLEGARGELEAVDVERRSARTRLEDEEAHRQRHAQAMQALRALVDADVEVVQAHDAALSALQHHRQQRERARRLPDIDRELPEARALSARQARARQQAQALGVVGAALAASLVAELLDGAEQDKQRHEDAARAARLQLAELVRRLQAQEQRRQGLEEREPVWREQDARARRIAAELSVSVQDRASLQAARQGLQEQLGEVRRGEERLQADIEQHLHEARQLLAAGGVFPQALLRLRDDLGAELLAGSFEHVGIEEAGRLEARLGKLAQALVVDDLKGSARAAAIRAGTLPEVLLVARDADLDQLNDAAADVVTGEQDVAVWEGGALRVSRISSQPRLGRRARERRAKQLQEQADAWTRELESTRTQRRTLERLVADGEALLAGLEDWLAGDPATELAAVKRTLLQTQTECDQVKEEGTAHAQAAAALRPRVEGLRKLLPEATLLDPPLHAERVEGLLRERGQAMAAQIWVSAHDTHAQIVDRHLSTLRQPPLSAKDLTRLEQSVRTLTERRDQLADGIEALRYARDNVHALSYSAAPGRLAHEQALLPAIKAQLREAQQEQNKAQKALDAADDALTQANERHNSEDAKHQGALDSHRRALQRFAALAVPDPSEAALSLASAQLKELESEENIQSQRRDTLNHSKGRQEEALQQRETDVGSTRRSLDKARAEAEPSKERWAALRERAAQEGLLRGLPEGGPPELAGVRGSANCSQEARGWHGRLLDRLQGAQRAQELHAQLELLHAPQDGSVSESYLDIWLKVRDWLRQRLPAQVAENDDPREALLRLRDRLTSIEERLKLQEENLRGSSADVAAGIQTQMRKAYNQIQRLNRNLGPVSFGSIKSIRVQPGTVERMQAVLRALREGSVQGLLFDMTEIPIEEALEEIFKRYGGGRTGGQRLLDYREYLELKVEIQRSTGTDWELANPTHLSTGEAIGVGAALMMVVLTAWEQDASFLRGKRAHGSLRFLFLDEANRLSLNNLVVLFDLCRTLELQLLIAAPEVALAAGNTTYRLVRHVAADGREEVHVSGRRLRETR